MTHILLIDGNNGYASMYVPALSRLSHEGQPTGGVMGLAQSLNLPTAKAGGFRC